ncbi:hypothetical protein D9619_008445 [Psilocybe cf. subviscida]|uniref:F-box domain-containing protein n=1 Tax=Psilocybe cf. subviscida TaxID=2480587 RepID=A0A8H5B9R1_9AGAR|nr:hypothetical protein D9619_008445 [Psilocybe cf. subviscida]
MSQQHPASMSLFRTFAKEKLLVLRRLMTFPRLRRMKTSQPLSSTGSELEHGGAAPEHQAEAKGRATDPLSCLPVELGSYILLLSLPDPKEEIIRNGGTPTKTYNTPLGLASVCSRWRKIAFEEPRLWTTVALSPSMRFAILSDVTSLENWLTRSGALPVSVFFNTEGCMVHDEFISRCILAINKVSSRWDAINLTIPYALTGLICSSPARNYLHICSLEHKYDALPPSQPITLRPTHISHLDIRPLRDIYLFDRVVRLAIPNHNMDSASWLLLLKQCPRLEYAAMKVVRSSEGLGQHLPRKTQLMLPHLTTLGITSSVVVLRQLLSRITTPKLAIVSIEIPNDAPLPLDPLRSLLKRSGNPEMQYLELECHDADEVDLLDFLSTVPSLGSLYITHWAGRLPRAIISDEFFRRLLWCDLASNGSTFLPNLQNLAYYGRRYFSWEFVAAVCNARLHPQPSAQVSLMGSVSILVPSDWSVLYTTGMDIWLVFVFLQMFEATLGQDQFYLCLDPHTIRRAVEKYGIEKLSDSMRSVYLLYLKRHELILRLAKPLR